MILIAALAAAVAVADSIPHGFTVDTLAPGVYAFVRKEVPSYGMESNSLLVVGTRYAAVVDAQMNRTDTREVIDAIRSLTPLPVRYVINTHCHDDHVTGNVEYRAAFSKVDFVASKTMAEEMDGICATNRAAFRRQGSGTIGFLTDLIGRGQSLIGGPSDDEERIAHLSYARLIGLFLAEAEERPVKPTITFADHLTLDLGGRSIEVMSLGRGHSRGDVVVHLPAERIVAAGDLVVWPVPLIGTTSYPGDFATTLERLIGLNPVAILPGHGPVLTDPTYVHDVMLLLRSIESQVAGAVGRGESLEATRAS